jgi:hypothetical protein
MPEPEHIHRKHADSAEWILIAGALLLLCAPVLPSPARIIVLPALLLAPGYSLLRLIGHGAGDLPGISLAIPFSLVVVICVSLLLDVAGIRLGASSLGPALGALTALLLASSYGRRALPPRRGNRKVSTQTQPSPSER